MGGRAVRRGGSTPDCGSPFRPRRQELPPIFPRQRPPSFTRGPHQNRASLHPLASPSPPLNSATISTCAPRIFAGIPGLQSVPALLCRGAALLRPISAKPKPHATPHPELLRRIPLLPPPNQT